MFNARAMPLKAENARVRWPRRMVEEARAKGRARAAEAESEPTKAELEPTKAELLPAKAESVPVEAESLPIEAESLPAEAESVPVEAELLPVKAELLPIKTESWPCYDEPNGIWEKLWPSLLPEIRAIIATAQGMPPLEEWVPPMPPRKCNSD